MGFLKREDYVRLSWTEDYLKWMKQYFEEYTEPPVIGHVPPFNLLVLQLYLS